jgi:phenazine biosynthesis protein phzE
MKQLLQTLCSGSTPFCLIQKQDNELFMVVDEELKMMARMCDRGGAIVGPLLKEMSQLIHSEYLLAGESGKDIFDLFIDSMFAATVVGSPVENGCNIIARYSDASRRYYGSAMMLVGRDEAGGDFLDSPITIRTAEIDLAGRMHLSVGATLVKDSVPEEEVLETRAKGSAILASIISPGSRTVRQPLLPRLYNDDEIIETMVQRNQNLSNFWFFKQENGGFGKNDGGAVSITIIHNEDDFAYMLRHMFFCMGITTSVVRYNGNGNGHPPGTRRTGGYQRRALCRLSGSPRILADQKRLHHFAGGGAVSADGRRQVTKINTVEELGRKRFLRLLKPLPESLGKI